MTLNTIYITRHGFRSNWLPPDQRLPSVTGIDSDPPLAPHGVDQANQLADYIAEQLDPKPQLIFSSPFYRCIQTINPAADRLDTDIYVDRGIGEWFKPDRSTIPVPADAQTLATYFPRVSDDWDWDTQVPSSKGETETDIFNRCKKFWHNFFPKLEAQFPEVETIIIIGHAASKIALGMSLMGYKNNREFLLPVDGGDGKTTRIQASTCSLDRYELADGWHLKWNGITNFLEDGPEMNWHFASSEFEAGSDADVASRGNNNEEYQDVYVGVVFPPDRNRLDRRPDDDDIDIKADAYGKARSATNKIAISGLSQPKPLVQMQNNLYMGEWSKEVGTELVFNENGEYVTKVDSHIVLNSGKLEDTNSDKEPLLKRALDYAKEVADKKAKTDKQ